jgi:hypothetical protein
MFSKLIKSFVVNLHIGMCENKQGQKVNGPLHPSLGIFLPSNDFYTCEPLPIEWIELIHGGPFQKK